MPHALEFRFKFRDLVLLEHFAIEDWRSKEMIRKTLMQWKAFYHQAG